MRVVEALDDQSGAHILTMLAPQSGDFDEAAALSRRLGGLPLALRLVGSYLAAVDAVPLLPGFRPVRRFSEFGTADHLRLSDQMNTALSDRERLSRTWELSLDLLAHQGIPIARVLLRLLACFPSIPVPLSILDTSEPAVAQLFPDSDPASLAAAVQALRRVGLVEVAEPRDSFGPAPAGIVPAVVLHPVIREMSRTDDPSIALACLRGLERAVETHPIGRNDENYWPWHVLLPLCIEPAEWLPPSVTEANNGAIAYLQFHAGSFLMSQDAHEWAVAIFDEVIARHTEADGADSIAVFMARHNRACALRADMSTQGLQAAVDAFVDLIRDEERVVGPDHPITQRSRQVLGCVYEDVEFFGVTLQHDTRR